MLVVRIGENVNITVDGIHTQRRGLTLVERIMTSFAGYRRDGEEEGERILTLGGIFYVPACWSNANNFTFYSLSQCFLVTFAS